jgi:hypothetical protein
VRRAKRAESAPTYPFHLESFELATNSVTATLMVFQEIPSQIAVIAKPISGVGPFNGFESAFEDIPGNPQATLDPVLARMIAFVPPGRKRHECHSRLV